MDATPLQYDPRYLAGIVLFNRGDFFEAHEVWESIWMHEHGPDRKFFQGLIQAAVALCHFCNGNAPGAIKLYRSSRDYMSRYGASHLGLDQTLFWGQMERCFADLLAANGAKVAIQEELIPMMELKPAPDVWPEPEPYLEEEN